MIGHMFTYVDLRSGKKIIQTLFLFFKVNIVLVVYMHGAGSHASQCVQTINERWNLTLR